MNTLQSENRAAHAKFESDYKAAHAEFRESYNVAHAQTRADWAQFKTEMAEREKANLRWQIATMLACAGLVTVLVVGAIRLMLI